MTEHLTGDELAELGLDKPALCTYQEIATCGQPLKNHVGADHTFGTEPNETMILTTERDETRHEELKARLESVRLGRPLIERLRDTGPFRASDGITSVALPDYMDAWEAADELARLASVEAERDALKAYKPCEPCLAGNHDDCTGDCSSMCCALAAAEESAERAERVLKLIGENSFETHGFWSAGPAIFETKFAPGDFDYLRSLIAPAPEGAE
jgi:hypothetical protein